MLGLEQRDASSKGRKNSVHKLLWYAYAVRGRGRVAQLEERPSKVLVWCNSAVSSILGRGKGVRNNCRF